MGKPAISSERHSAARMPEEQASNGSREPDFLFCERGEQIMWRCFGCALVVWCFAFSPLAFAQASDEVDANGLYKEPVCRLAPSIKNSLKTLAGQEPTGITASNQKWDMEIYLDKTEGDWSVVAKDKSPDASPRKLCVIAQGISTSPYSQQKWYIANFLTSK